MSYVTHCRQQALGNDNRIVMMPSKNRLSLIDGFAADGTYSLNPAGTVSPNGLWYSRFINGSGAGVRLTTSGGSSWVSWQQPTISTQVSGNETHACLILSNQAFTDFEMTFDTRTVAQVRQNFPPKNWERSWILWRWSDDFHHYYYTLKNSGSEFGKKDNDNSTDAQIFLYTGTPSGAVVGSVSGAWQSVRIRAEGSRHQIWVNDIQVIDYYDTTSSGATPKMAQGKIGLYEEDALCEFRSMQIIGL